MPALLLVSLPEIAAAQAKKYDLKSGVVTFEVVITMGATQIKNKAVVSFDEYGMKERRDNYQGDTLKDSLISDGKDLILLVHAEKKAYKQGPATRGTELKFDWNEVSERDKKEGKAKKAEPMTVAGKKCESFELDQRGTKTRFAGTSGGVTLFTEANMGKMKNTMQAVKFEENAKVSPDLFKVPADYALQ
jgi:hypothetical protein